MKHSSYLKQPFPNFLVTLHMALHGSYGSLLFSIDSISTLTLQQQLMAAAATQPMCEMSLT